MSLITDEPHAVLAEPPTLQSSTGHIEPTQDVARRRRIQPATGRHNADPNQRDVRRMMEQRTVHERAGHATIETANRETLEEELADSRS